MTTATLSISISVAILGAIAMLLISRIRMMNASPSGPFRSPSSGRYQPMLRLLSEEEFAFAGNNKAMRRKMLQERHKLFREYLRCLARDYGQLLNGIRLVMLQSASDRPELVKMLAQNRAHFVLALCRIELSLRMHQLGVGRVDVSGLVRAVDALRSTHAALLPSASPFAI